MLNRELQKCHLVKEIVVGNKYLVAVQKEKGGGIALGEGKTLAQAATLALTYAHQRVYSNVERIQEFKKALSNKYKKQMFVPAFKQFYLQQNFYTEGKNDE